MNITDITKQISYNYIRFFRLLQNNNNNDVNQTALNEQIHQQQVRDLYIYLAALVSLIIIILGGYALYRKCIEKKVMREIEREYQLMIYNMLNSFSSQNSSSEDNKRPHSYNNVNSNNLPNFENIFNDQNMDASINYNNHEERMENIRKKFGNSIVIKCLIKKQIEEIPFTKNFAEDYGDICTICMENFSEHITINKTPCEHIFHKKCFDKYLKSIKNKDKLLCPNCNQNLLINKKYLKLRVKTKTIEIKKEMSKEKEMSKQKEIKESELNLETKKRHSVMTNKNEDNSPQENNEIIFVKKKGGKSTKNKINNNKQEKNKIINNDIYSPLQLNIKNEKNTIVSNDNKEEKEENNNIDKNKKKHIIIINPHKKTNNNLKNPKIIDESKKKFYNKRKNKKINELSSERDIIIINNNNNKASSSKIPVIKKDN